MAGTVQSERLAFDTRLEAEGLSEFLTTVKDQHTMQLNITKRCNLSCKHCHVASSPTRTEEMSGDTLQACLDVFAAGPFISLDITGGAPELNPHYRWLIEEAARIAEEKRSDGLEARIITRTNAAIITEPGFEDLPGFWAEHGIQVVASLPHYEEQKTNKMRGEGVFDQVIKGLKSLNAVGYGSNEDSSQITQKDLILSLVLNPGGAILPPAQVSAEREFKKELRKRYDVSFTNLLVITNNPVGRFYDFLEGRSLLDAYMTKLYGAFNPATVEGAMCRDQISVDVDGRIYDCDFNQIEDLPVLETCQMHAYPLLDVDENPARVLTIFDLQRDGLSTVAPRRIRVGDHCYACTAGAGSSCGGSTA